MKCKYEGSGAWEGRCVGTKEVDPCIGIEKCDRYKPDCLTNADRIRAMSDEELVELLNHGCCPYIEGECTMMWCEECISEWLKQPAKDGDNDD